jgi:hypothetical protein
VGTTISSSRKRDDIINNASSILRNAGTIEKSNSQTHLAPTAADCLKIYSNSLHRAQMKRNILKYVQPYDAVSIN